MNAREVIRRTLIECSSTQRAPWMDAVISDLEAAGFVILSRSEMEAIRDKALEEAAAYVEGKDGRIPGANAFVALVSGNRQPCMSGDGRDRLYPHTRRDFDDATLALAAAIRKLKSGGE